MSELNEFKSLLQSVERIVVTGNRRGKNAAGEMLQEAVYAQTDKDRLIFKLREKKVEEIVTALRCISTVGGHCIGRGCPYYEEERIPEELRGEFGDTLEGCNVDRIGLEAADVLEMFVL